MAFLSTGPLGSSFEPLPQEQEQEPHQQLLSLVPGPLFRYVDFTPISKAEYDNPSIRKRNSTIDSRRDAQSRFSPEPVMTFRLHKNEIKLIRSTLEAHGFLSVSKMQNKKAGAEDKKRGQGSLPVGTSGEGCWDWNVMWTVSHLKPYSLQSMLRFQKVNHFPRTYEATRKDKLYRNVHRMQQLHGRSFDFIPKTFILPAEINNFYEEFAKLTGAQQGFSTSALMHGSPSRRFRDRELEHMRAASDPYPTWICKPWASSQGKGIFLVNDPDSIPSDLQCIVSRYVSNPLLIDGFKFDLRIYVAVTSYEPLRIYVHEDGLARFATTPYRHHPRNLGALRMHLTNYSINKSADTFVQNTDPDVDNVGNKWSLRALLEHLHDKGFDDAQIFTDIVDIIVKTILSIETHVGVATRMFQPHRGNCFELFGFDIMIDDTLKPWLMEVNLSPSLACESPLDLRIKSRVISDLFNLACIRKVDRASEMDRERGSLASGAAPPRKLHSSSGRRPTTNSSPVRRQRIPGAQTFEEYTADLQVEERRILRESIDEYQRRGGFLRVYPSDGTQIYNNYFEMRRPLNDLLHDRLITLEKLMYPVQSRLSMLDAEKDSDSDSDGGGGGGSVDGSDHSDSGCEENCPSPTVRRNNAQRATSFSLTPSRPGCDPISPGAAQPALAFQRSPRMLHSSATVRSGNSIVQCETSEEIIDNSLPSSHEASVASLSAAKSSDSAVQHRHDGIRDFTEKIEQFAGSFSHADGSPRAILAISQNGFQPNAPKMVMNQTFWKSSSVSANSRHHTSLAAGSYHDVTAAGSRDPFGKSFVPEASLPVSSKPGSSYSPTRTGSPSRNAAGRSAPHSGSLLKDSPYASPVVTMSAADRSLSSRMSRRSNYLTRAPQLSSKIQEMRSRDLLGKRSQSAGATASSTAVPSFSSASPQEQVIRPRAATPSTSAAVRQVHVSKSLPVTTVSSSPPPPPTATSNDVDGSSGFSRTPCASFMPRSPGPVPRKTLIPRSGLR
eukprot:ANDGO_05244.mRNA.1 putative beta-tubulin polyglutamylase